MRRVVGTDMSDIEKLTVEGGEILILPGYVTQNYGDVRFSETEKIMLTEAKKIEDTILMITDYVNEIGDSKGLKLDVSSNLKGDVMVRKLGFSFQKKLTHVLKTLKEDPEEVVYIESTDKLLSNRTAIYNVSRMMKMKVNAEYDDEEGLWCIEMADTTNGRPKSTKRIHGIFETVRTWLDSIEYNTPTTPPETFTRDIADSYLRTMFNKAPWDILYRKGKVIKCRVLVKQHKNQWRVTLNSNPLLSLGEYDSTLIELALAPHGLTVDDVIVIGDKINNVEQL